MTNYFPSAKRIVEISIDELPQWFIDFAFSGILKIPINEGDLNVKKVIKFIFNNYKGNYFNDNIEFKLQIYRQNCVNLSFIKQKGNFWEIPNDNLYFIKFKSNVSKSYNFPSSSSNNICSSNNINFKTDYYYLISDKVTFRNNNNCQFDVFYKTK